MQQPPPRPVRLWILARLRSWDTEARDVQGVVPNFQECFIGEGNYDPAEAMMLLARNGFTVFLLDDHVPHMVNDSPWAHRGRAWSTGYIKALIDAVNGLN